LAWELVEPSALLQDQILVLMDAGNLSFATTQRVSNSPARLARLVEVHNFNLLLQVEVLPLACHTNNTELN